MSDHTWPIPAMSSNRATGTSHNASQAITVQSVRDPEASSTTPGTAGEPDLKAPRTAAAMMTIGNGMANTNRAAKAAAAIHQSLGNFSARRATRRSASTTIASTAALTP